MKIKVRFAPSPTGTPHVGLIRTALINYIYAKQNNGEILLRFEDTDNKRNTNDSEEMILDALQWCGISFSNIDKPFMQSNRLSIYDSIMEKLIKSEKTKHFLYKCNCKGKHEKKTCIKNTDLNSEGALRFNIERYINKYDNKLQVDDIILGKVEFKISDINDFVLSRSDKSYLYVFTNTIDDIEMGVTHIIRGVDLLNTTPSQILLIKLISLLHGENIKFHYGHIPLIKAHGGGKLSKRDQDSNFFQYIKDGYLSEAIVNYLLALGSGSSNDKTTSKISELIKLFEIKRLKKSNVFFDKLKLKAINGQYIRGLSKKDFVDQYLFYIEKYSNSIFKDEILKSSFKEKLYQLSSSIQTRIKLLNEVESYILPILLKGDKFVIKDMPINKEILSVEKLKNKITLLIDNFNQEIYDKIIPSLEKEERKFLRYAVAGANITLPLKELIEIIDKNELINRIEKAFNILEN